MSGTASSGSNPLRKATNPQDGGGPQDPQPSAAEGDAPTSSERGGLVAVSWEFTGPVPPPAMLAEYDQVLPGSAREIFDRAGREQAFRHETTKEFTRLAGRKLELAARRSLLGQIAAFVLGVLAIGGGIGLAAFDKDTAGIASISIGIAALTTAFVVGRLTGRTNERVGGPPVVPQRPSTDE